MATANSKESSRLRREEVSLYKGEHRITFSGHTLNVERARIPQAIDRLEYSVSAEEPAAVSRIQMSFSNFSRELKVEGSSADQVDAVFSSLKDDLIDISSVVGGPLFTFYLFGALSLGMFLYIFSTLFDWVKLKKRPLFAPLGLSVIAFILLWTLPIGQMFKGFSAIQGDASFMVRYGPQISFLGLILSFVGILISYYLSKAKPEKRC